jgi:phosphoglycolate phosphatase-like HAD superfamily hydrolase
MTQDKPARLMLFDIDGTLLSTYRKGWEEPFKSAIEVTFRELNIPVTVDASRFRAGGKTDPQIIWELLGGAVTEDVFTQALPLIQKRYLRSLRDKVKGPQHVQLKPGVKELLPALEGRKDLLLGLLTGNFEEGARWKLETHKLNRYFPFGAFGDGAMKRIDLPPRAIAEAKRVSGHDFTKKEIVIIGDTPNDVQCGKPLDVRTIAVASSNYKMDELAAEKPDFLFQDLTDTEKVIQAILEEI